jgi:hypothetical protein
MERHAVAVVDPTYRPSQRIACTHRQICAAELTAGFCGFTAFDVADTWVTDNVAAARALVRGHSGSPECDTILRAWPSTGRVPRYVRWVCSEGQLADPLTRVDEVYTPKPCRGPHLLLRVRWGGSGGGGALCKHGAVITALPKPRLLARVATATLLGPSRATSTSRENDESCCG